MGKRGNAGKVRREKFSDLWITEKSGFDNETLDSRKAKLTSWIQEAWPAGVIAPGIDRPQHKWKHYKECLRPLIETFDDSNFWPG